MRFFFFLTARRKTTLVSRSKVYWNINRSLRSRYDTPATKKEKPLRHGGSGGGGVSAGGSPPNRPARPHPPRRPARRARRVVPGDERYDERPPPTPTPPPRPGSSSRVESARRSRRPRRRLCATPPAWRKRPRSRRAEARRRRYRPPRAETRLPRSRRERRRGETSKRRAPPPRGRYRVPPPPARRIWTPDARPRTEAWEASAPTRCRPGTHRRRPPRPTRNGRGGTRAGDVSGRRPRESAAAARSAACASEAPPGRNASRTSPAMSLVISRNGSSHTSFVLEPISFKELDT